MCEIKKIPLQEYYNSLSKLGKVRFIAKVRMECGVSDRTVQRWIYGETSPRILEAKAIADLSGKSLKKLFPELV